METFCFFTLLILLVKKQAAIKLMVERIPKISEGGG